MADVITRLKVESNEYDNKLKRAAQSLNSMQETARRTGATMAIAEKEEIKFAQSLGNMGTVARNAKGRLAEMTNSLTEMTLVYKRMTDEEKKGEFGKALNASIQQLTQRCKEAKQELDGVTKEVSKGTESSKGFGDIVDKVTGKLGINVKQLGTLGAALGAATAAAKVAKDAFFSNEEQLDEWGRITASSESIYKSFLDALNTGDIGGFLSRINQIVSAARDAYDALDNLATYNAFNQINVERTRTGMTESIADYREGKGSKDDVKKSGEAYKNELRDRAKYEAEAYDKELRRLAKERGVSYDNLKKAMSGTYGNYKQLKNVQMTGERINYQPGIMGGGTTVTKYAANEQERLGDTLRRINDTELNALQALGAQAQRTQTEIAGVDKQLSRVLSGRSGGGSGSGTSSTKAEKDIKTAALNFKQWAAEVDLPFSASLWWSVNGSSASTKDVSAAVKQLKDKFSEATSGEERLALQGQINFLEMKLDQMNHPADWKIDENGISIPAKMMFDQKGLTESANKFNEMLNSKNGGKQKSDITVLGASQQLLGGLQSITGGLENLGVEFGDGFKKTLGAINGVMSILTGISTIVGVIQTLQIAMLARQMIPFFANGGFLHAANGVITGSHFSGDVQPLMVNAGEAVINQADQAALFRAIKDGNFGGGGSSVTVRGDELFITLNNYMRSSGMRFIS